MDYLSWKTIASDPACRAVRNGAEVWPLPNGGFYSGGHVYTHGLRTKRGTCYVVSRWTMKGVAATQMEMLTEQKLGAAQVIADEQGLGAASPNSEKDERDGN